MTTPAQSIIRDAHTALQDPGGVRWPATELVAYLNAGLVELVTARPDEYTQTIEHTLQAGSRQQIPASAVSLVDVSHNLTTRRAAVRKTERDYLEAVVPGWQSAQPAPEFVHFMHDMREPRVFHLYPPATPNARVALVCVMYPQAVAPADGRTADTVTGDVDARDQWAPALLNYVLYRAYAKDAEHAANATLAASHLALFTTATTTQLQAAAAVAPKS